LPNLRNFPHENSNSLANTQHEFSAIPVHHQQPQKTFSSIGNISNGSKPQLENENSFFNRLVSTSEKFLLSNSNNFNQGSPFSVQSSCDSLNRNNINNCYNSHTTSSLRNDFNLSSNSNFNGFNGITSSNIYAMNQTASSLNSNNSLTVPSSFIENGIAYENPSNMNAVTAAAVAAAAAVVSHGDTSNWMLNATINNQNQHHNQNYTHNLNSHLPNIHNHQIHSNHSMIIHGLQ
jgi:hypothetical protein